MPVASLRNVHIDDFERATNLTGAMARLITALPGSNSADVQLAVNTLLVDMAAYTKELLKTEIPATPSE